MTAIILDGQKVANQLAEKLKIQVRHLSRTPILIIISIGNNPENKIYLDKKINRGAQLGIKIKVHHLAASTNERSVIDLIQHYNQDQLVSGIMVQLPLPEQISYYHLVRAINPLKDVDGFNEQNVGRLWNGDSNFIAPATPRGILSLLSAYDLSLKGKHTVVMGRSNLVGKPLAGLCLAKDSTVTLTHRKTTNLREITKNADILVVAIGQAQMVDQSYVKPGAIVIDVGINTTAQGLMGDVNFSAVKEISSYITPV
ncbi:MAG: bifunctional methylenetetrahydrofolate dehydrogenase/methenyltetrahydrofolate cyclohydrolase, partial [Bombilactobacillus mellifer]|nr:bifunctional methylenetetrahydrofolate dehydrogenase/methenyltetrahydrofolate cyclohydrolase [Bombilactobacillus mellifer]